VIKESNEAQGKGEASLDLQLRFVTQNCIMKIEGRL